MSGVTVVCTLKPYGFRISDGTTIARRQTTTTNGSGVYTFTLEETSNITPAGSWYEIEEQTPTASGGRHVWAITVGADNATVAASLIATRPDQGQPDYLTQDQGDARYITTGDLNDHLADTADAHDASAISYNGGTGMSATDVEAAIDELATEKLNAATVPEVLIIPIGDETTAITTGTAKVTFHMPFAMTVSSVAAGLATPSSSGTPTFDINEAGVSILSTKITIDANETHSSTAATAPVLSDAALAANAAITIDVDVAGTGAKGAKIYIIGTRSV